MPESPGYKKSLYIFVDFCPCIPTSCFGVNFKVLKETQSPFFQVVCMSGLAISEKGTHLTSVSSSLIKKSENFKLLAIGSRKWY